MNELNQHISDYLTYYLNLSFSPHYAVMLTGEWGCGKTWLIKEFQEEFSTPWTSKFLYISLYGVNSYSEIDDQIFQQLHPVLSSKGMALTGKILKGVLRTSLHIDLDGDGKSDGTVSPQLPDIKIPDYLKNTSGCIFIFDDLERCYLPMKQVMGYINTFVEHDGLKVIILANVEEILKRSKSEAENYTRIKEKVVGHSFKVVPDKESAFDSFVKHIENAKIKSFLESQKDKIFEVFHLSGYNNLRILRQSLLDFERFLSFVEDKFQQKTALMEELLSIFIALSFEIKAGQFKNPDEKNQKIKEPNSLGWVSEYKKTTLDPVFNHIQDCGKYPFFNRFDLLLTPETWSDFFEKGFLNEDSVTESLTNSRYFQDEKTPAWQKLWYYPHLNDDDFEKIRDTVEKQWGNREFKYPPEILHVGGLFLRLSELEIYSRSKSDIVSDFKEYVLDIKDSGEWNDFEKNKNLESDISFGSYGLRNAGDDLTEFITIRDFLLGNVAEARADGLIDAGKSLLDVMKSDTDKFGRMITLNNSSEQRYFEIPIFKSISPKQFFDDFLQLENRAKHSVGRHLRNRYQYESTNRKLSSELPFLTELESFLESEGDKRKGTPSGYNLKLCRDAVLAAMQRLEQIQTMTCNNEQTPQPLTD